MTNLHLIIKGCIDNDVKSQKIFYEKYYGYAFKIAFRYIYRYENVADVVNDSFIKFFKNISSFVSIGKNDDEPRLMGWLKKIVMNTAIDALRKYKLIPITFGIPEDIWEQPGNGNNADERMLYKEMICHLKSLPPSYCAAFNMYVIDGFSHKEIAQHLHISVGTSKSNLFKAKAFLQKLIKNEDVYSDV